jgi:hypothetical protein
MPRGTLAFLQHSLAISVVGPLVGLVAFFFIAPGLLFFALLALPFAFAAAYSVGLVPAFLTSIVLFLARRHFGKLMTVVITAVAAALFATIWVLWVFPGPHHQARSFLVFIAAVSAGTSLIFSIPKWDADSRR